MTDELRDCPSLCVCLEFSHDWTEAPHLGPDYNRSDAVAFLVHHITRLMISMCLTAGEVTLITRKRWLLLGCFTIKLLSFPSPPLQYANISEDVLWEYISPLSPQTFTRWLASISKTCVQQVLCCLLTTDFQSPFPSTYINVNSVVREDCPFTPVCLIKYLYILVNSSICIFAYGL